MGVERVSGELVGAAGWRPPIWPGFLPKLQSSPPPEQQRHIRHVPQPALLLHGLVCRAAPLAAQAEPGRHQQLTALVIYPERFSSILTPIPEKFLLSQGE